MRLDASLKQGGKNGKVLLFLQPDCICGEPSSCILNWFSSNCSCSSHNRWNLLNPVNISVARAALTSNWLSDFLQVVVDFPYRTIYDQSAEYLHKHLFHIESPLPWYDLPRKCCKSIPANSLGSDTRTLCYDLLCLFAPWARLTQCSF